MKEFSTESRHLKLNFGTAKQFMGNLSRVRVYAIWRNDHDLGGNQMSSDLNTGYGITQLAMKVNGYVLLWFDIPSFLYGGWLARRFLACVFFSLPYLKAPRA